jgi:hypothetical protein
MVTVKLEKPIKHGSESIAELIFREPKAKDLRGLSMQAKADDLLKLAGKLCGQPDSVIDEMCIADTKKVLDLVSNFL